MMAHPSMRGFVAVVLFAFAGGAAGAADAVSVEKNATMTTSATAGIPDIATARKMWAYSKPQWPKVPETAATNALDAFINAKLNEQALKPAPRADKRTLIRRATFDLTGLPPTPEEVAAFIADDSSDAFNKVIERLLSSPHYGEQWGRHWLDVVRYADSLDSRGSGKEGDILDAWRYRDWVVKAFNDDLPYDQFITHQLAGDILSAQSWDADKVIATGMYAIGNWGNGDADKEKVYTDIVDDQIDVTGRAFLGLTFACARCHDHKFDPILTADYYGLAGFFFSSHILEKFADKTQGEKLMRIALLAPEESKSASTPQCQGLQEGGIARTPYEGIHEARIHVRGRYDRLGDEVPRHFPSLFSDEKRAAIKQGSGRLELAQWIASRDNPLTARVMVNRLWQHHFGEGIVRTPNNFGKLGTPPTHPELLDWLTLTFINNGWSVKAMHRLIMTSDAYQRSSIGDAQHDADNLYLARFPRRSLSAEELRDSMIFTTGQLDATLGGVSVRDLMLPRRTLYVTTVRSDRTTYQMLFDGADPTAIVDKRTQSVVAPQALFLMNHPFVIQQAEVLAHCVMQAAQDDSARVTWLYQKLYQRAPKAREMDIAAQALNHADERAWAAWCQVLLCSNEFMYVD